MKFVDPTEKTLAEKRYYLAGPMSGYPQFNIPQFYRVASILREAGYKVINPAEEDSSELRDACLRSLTGDLKDIKQVTTWASVLSRDVAIVGELVDGVILLQGWEKSRGAKLEVFVARLLGLEILLYFEGSNGHTVTPLEDQIVVEGLLG